MALEYFCQILNAFLAIHELNILHRDIKLENVMIKNNVLKVVDFGFAKTLKDRAAVTETVLGSPVYMGNIKLFL
jgi:serine/threonine protein kinase